MSRGDVGGGRGSRRRQAKEEGVSHLHQNVQRQEPGLRERLENLAVRYCC